jgi:hypothetical protein
VLPKIELQCSLMIQTAFNPFFIHVTENQIDWIYSIQSQVFISHVYSLKFMSKYHNFLDCDSEILIKKDGAW